MAAENLHEFDQTADEEESEGGIDVAHRASRRAASPNDQSGDRCGGLLDRGIYFLGSNYGLSPDSPPRRRQQAPGRYCGQLVAHDIGEPFMVALKLGLAIGIMVASPVLLYQTWAFISPALTRRERKYALPFTLLGVGLFVVGLAVGFVVLR